MLEGGDVLALPYLVPACEGLPASTRQMLMLHQQRPGVDRVGHLCRELSLPPFCWQGHGHARDTLQHLSQSASLVQHKLRDVALALCIWKLERVDVHVAAVREQLLPDGLPDRAPDGQVYAAAGNQHNNVLQIYRIWINL